MPMASSPGEAGKDAQQYALSAVWTAYGAVLVAVGLIRRNASLRWIGMALLAITIVKVFFLDLRELDIVYNILDFASDLLGAKRGARKADIDHRDAGSMNLVQGGYRTEHGCGAAAVRTLNRTS